MSIGPYYPNVRYLAKDPGYIRGDVVFYLAASWECIKNCEDIAPPDTEHWKLFAKGN
jgi:hypothetical protein